MRTMQAIIAEQVQLMEPGEDTDFGSLAEPFDKIRRSRVFWAAYIMDAFAAAAERKPPKLWVSYVQYSCTASADGPRLWQRG